MKEVAMAAEQPVKTVQKPMFWVAPEPAAEVRQLQAVLAVFSVAGAADLRAQLAWAALQAHHLAAAAAVVAISAAAAVHGAAAAADLITLIQHSHQLLPIPADVLLQTMEWYLSLLPVPLP
jgi:hypothetical protein